MIRIIEKKNCCGCSACQQICPKGCITMQADNEGFDYPVVNESQCVDCHLCEKVCPVLNRFNEKTSPLHCYLAKSKDEEIRIESSSGGIFTELATSILQNGGVVFGVLFDDKWQAVYDYTETIEGLIKFRGSKYLQAKMLTAYSQVQRFLNQNRLVLFTGTPCSVAGLNHFLRKEYENLLTMDVVCHSIPSQKIWQQYISEIEKDNGSKITYASFRDKSNGWTNYSIRLDFIDKAKKSIVEKHDENAYMKGFTYDLFTRPSCSSCPARNYTSGSDLTIADAWRASKYHPGLNDEKGLSHILVNSPKGFKYIASLNSKLDSLEIDYQEVEPFSVHAPITRSCKPNPYRGEFFERVNKGASIKATIEYLVSRYDFNNKLHRTFIYRLMKKIFNYINS